MALTTVRYGRYSASAEAAYGVVGSGYVRACVFNSATQNVWVHTMGGWIRKSGATNSTVRFGLYSTSSNNPATRLGHTSSLSVTSTSMASRTAAVSVTDASPLQTAIKLASGSLYAIAILSTTASTDHSMVVASAITATNEQFYNRSGLSSMPAPFGSYSASTEGHMTVWAEGYLNVKPEVATGLSPSGTINDTAPSFVATFQDLNGAYGTSSGNGVDTGDRMTKYAIQVRTSGSATADRWDATYTATGVEQSNNAIARAYGGSTLTRGTTYEWRIRFYDEFNEAGDWTAWTSFLPADLGYVTTDGNPTGKVEDNSPDFEGRWTHQSGTSTNAVQIRLYDGSGVLLQDSGTISKTVTSSASPGTLFTITWAQSTFADLTWGAAYQYEIRGRDTSNVWSNYSTPKRSFTTNAAPSTPASLSPSASTIYTSYPLLTCQATDVDDTTATGLVVSARIKNNSGTVLYTRSMTYSTGNARWEYQTTATDLASYATYKWDARSYDGTLYSGGVTSVGSAVYSSEGTFVYAQGPTVTMSSPTDGSTVTTSALTVTWTTTNQVQYRVRIYPDGGATALYDSGWTVSGTSSHNVPSGYIANGVSYDLVVDVEDSTPLTGSSGIVDITASFTPPATLTNVTTSAIKTVGTNPWATAVSVSWDQSSDANFVEYIVRRSAETGPDMPEVILARITAQTTTTFTDYTPASGVEYTYSVSQVSSTSGEEIESLRESSSVEVTFGGVVLTAVGSSASTTQAALRYTSEREEERVIDEVVYQPLDGSNPQTVRSATRYRTMVFDAVLPLDDYSTAAQKKSELEELDIANVTVCYRDNYGRKMFGRLAEVTFTDQVPGWWRASITVREEYYSEAVV
jgi:hypothetical protein